MKAGDLFVTSLKRKTENHWQIPNPFDGLNSPFIFPSVQIRQGRLPAEKFTENRFPFYKGG